MDYNAAESQANQLRQQSQELLTQMQQLAQRLRGEAKDETTGRELAMDLREIAMQMQSRDNATLMLIQQMAQYIHQLEQDHATHPQPTARSGAWRQGAGGGGFLGNLMSGIGLGAGFGLADDVVNDIFNAF